MLILYSLIFDIIILYSLIFGKLFIYTNFILKQKSQKCKQTFKYLINLIYNMALTKHFIVFCTALTNLKFEFIFINFMKWFFLFNCLLNKWLLVLNYKLQCTLTMYTYTYINCNSKKVYNSKKQYVIVKKVCPKFGRPLLWEALFVGGPNVGRKWA